MAKKKSKSKLPLWTKILLSVVVLFALVIAVYENQKYFRRAYRYFSAKYIKTEWRKTDFPDKYTLHGIDVSHYQDEINWKLLKNSQNVGKSLVETNVVILAYESVTK
jgi:lysozyme